MRKHIFDSKFYKPGKIYGTTTLGARGQLVIPVEARRDLALKSGDQLLVVGKHGKVLGLVKADQLASFVNSMIEHIENPAIKAVVKKHADEFLKQSKLKH